MKHVYHFSASQYKGGSVRLVTHGLVERLEKVLTPDDYDAVLECVSKDLDSSMEVVITSLSYLGAKDE